jgi:hypothetical protein
MPATRFEKWTEEWQAQPERYSELAWRSRRVLSNALNYSRGTSNSAA